MGDGFNSRQQEQHFYLRDQREKTENTKGWEKKGYTEDRNTGVHPKPCSPFQTALITLEYLKEEGWRERQEEQ